MDKDEEALQMKLTNLRHEIKEVESEIEKIRFTKESKCVHQLERIFVSGPRDNNERYYHCTKCGYYC